MPAILAGTNPRIVNLSSAGHTHSDVNLDDPNFEKGEYNAWEPLRSQKSANIHFTRGNSSPLWRSHTEFRSPSRSHYDRTWGHLTPELINEMTERVKSRSTSSSEAKGDRCSAIQISGSRSSNSGVGFRN
ncbi:MAG: hypothetical protein Ct9H90mP5_11540 [Acidimicrobiaceae bacterium]|nr:MAG: hypothetical protein Ct9H90mP5_11540 [Acidimicrobiaceae bacterium]